MTPELAAERAGDILAVAEHAENDRAIALVAVADAWTRLHNALAATRWLALDPAEQPKPVNIGGLTVKDVDAEKIGRQAAELITGWPRISQEPAASEPEDAYYHWMITYLAPTFVGFDVCQRSGTCQPNGRTRLEMFETLAQQVMDETGLTVDGFSVLYFTLEPNQIP